jgi:hypothetical protein
MYWCRMNGKPPPTIVRRLGIAPAARSVECVACNNCPDLFELDDGDFAVIGFDVTEELADRLPDDAGCGPAERIVRIPRAVLVAARREIPCLV